ncbi:MAG: 4-alpha-glucanotransferase [Merdibacter sp.]
MGYGNSPYQPFSSFAGDPLFINIDRLSEIGLLKQSSIRNLNKFKESVSYDEVRAFKETYFRKAFYEFKKNFASFQQEYDCFCRECEWLEDYAVFITFKKLNGMKAWTEWPLEMREWPKRRSIDLEPYGNDIFYEKFLQYMFYTQWVEIRDHAHEKGIRIMGDIPFYVGLDSVDVWVNRDCFLLEEDGTPSYVAGVPPDYFSESGQRWGNPIYDWKQMEKDKYEFWVRRLAWQNECYGYRADRPFPSV